MELTPRLQAIAEQVPQGAHFADVGTDHGYLPVWLLCSGRIDSAIAADLREGPLDRARETAGRFGVEELISFRLCDGLSAIRPEEADTVAIAGMGGETIISILEAAPWTKEGTLLLLQPMTGSAELRLWLQEHGYQITGERIACEGEKLYNILTVKGGEMPPLSPAELWAGRQNGGPQRLEYLDQVRNRVEKALRGQQAARSPDHSKVAGLIRVLSGLTKMEKELETMTTVGGVYKFLQEKAPFELQESFDNSGFLVGREGTQVSKILVALDITEQVVEEAAEQGVQLIVAHHPVIFGNVKSITDRTVTGRVLLSLAEQGIAAICAHTNLDAVEGGVNDALALRLGLTDIEQLKQMGMDDQGRAYGIGRIGRVTKQPLYDFAMGVKRLLGSNGLRLVDGGKPVHKVAVGGGACAGMMDEVLAKGCDTFVTSDVKYNYFLEAKAQGLNLIDAGHFPTEDVVCPVLRDWLTEQFPQVSVSISKRHHEVFSYL